MITKALGITYTAELGMDHDGFLGDLYEAKVKDMTVIINDLGFTVLLSVTGPTIMPALHRFPKTILAFRAATAITGTLP